MENMNFCAMAFGKTNVSSEGGEGIKRYVGVGSSYVLGINPNKKELEAIYGRDIDNEPEYTGTQEVDNKDIPYIRIDVILQTDPAVCNGIDMKTKVAFFIRKEARYNKDKTKVQVIDRYGRTCWVTVEQAKHHEIPEYSNGPANIDKDYRPAYVGEEDLTNFLRVYLNIGNVMDYKNGTWVMKDNPQDYECRLEKIADYFKGDVSEVKEAIALMPKNKVKLLYGVRTGEDGKLYQAVYTQKALLNGTTDYSKLDKELQERKANGAYPTTVFEVCDLKEYVVNATEFSEPASAENPFEETPDAGMDADPWEL